MSKCASHNASSANPSPFIRSKPQALPSFQRNLIIRLARQRFIQQRFGTRGIALLRQHFGQVGGDFSIRRRGVGGRVRARRRRWRADRWLGLLHHAV